MSEPGSMGERRRRREEERRRLEESGELAATPEAPPPTRRQLREAQRAAEERAAAERAFEEEARELAERERAARERAELEQAVLEQVAREEQEARRSAASAPPPSSAAPTSDDWWATGEQPVSLEFPAPAPPAAGASEGTGEVPRARRPVVRPPAMSQRPPASPSSGGSASPPAAPPASARPAASASARPTSPRSRPATAVLRDDDPPSGRPRWVMVVAAAGVVLLAVVAAVWLLGRDGGDGPEQTAGPQGTATALLALEQGGEVTGASLLSVGDSETSALLLPSRLLVDVAGGGRIPLAESITVSDDAPGNAVADALDLRVDGTWVLTSGAMAQLVDAGGGIVVDVDTEVRSGDVLLVAGAGQRLTGAQAAAYATYLADGEAEAVRLARQERVLSQLIAALPTDPADVTATLELLGEGSRTTLSEGRLDTMLSAASSHAADGSYGASVLPVTEIATGGDEVLYGIDPAAASEVLAARFAGAQREGAEDAVRVLVQNGVGTPGLGEDARSRLVEAGFRFVGGGNAESLGRPTSAVLVPSDTEANRSAGLAVAEALGLPAEVVAVGQEAPTMADVVVVLGADFATVAGRTP